MFDREFLKWLHNRLTSVHNEDPAIDYMYKLRSIIEKMPKKQLTPNTTMSTSIEDLTFEA